MNLPKFETILLTIVFILATMSIIAAPWVLSSRFGPNSVEAASVITSGLLSLALVILYLQQYRLLKRQTDLKERDFESSLARRGTVTANEDTVYTNLRNVGRGSIRYLYLRSEITSDTGSFNLKPGRYQMRRVEDDTRSLDSFCEISEFEADVNILIEDKDTGELYRRPFKYIASNLMEDDIEACTLRLTVEIIDEAQESGTIPKEYDLANPEVRISREVERKFETADGEQELRKVTWPNSLTKGLGPRYSPDPEIIPKDLFLDQ